MESLRKQQVLKEVLDYPEPGCADNSSVHLAGIPACSDTQRQHFHSIAGLSCCTVEYFVFVVASYWGRFERRGSWDSDPHGRKVDSALEQERRSGAAEIDSWRERLVVLPDFRPCHTCFVSVQRVTEGSDMEPSF